MAYVAQMVFALAASRSRGLPMKNVRMKPDFLRHAIRIAEKVLAGTYKVNDADARTLIKAISLHPAYARPKTLRSDGV